MITGRPHPYPHISKFFKGSLIYSKPKDMGESSIWQIIILAIYPAAVVIPVWKITEKAGFKGVNDYPVSKYRISLGDRIRPAACFGEATITIK